MDVDIAVLVFVSRPSDLGQSIGGEAYSVYGFDFKLMLQYLLSRNGWLL